MRLFNSFIASANLLDVPHQNASFTWSNFRESASHSLIDCFLVTNAIMDKFWPLGVKRLCRPTSDQYPLLSFGAEKWGPFPFRFENVWLIHHSFSPLFEYWWKNTPLRGWPGHGFIQKLKTLKLVIKEWNKNTFGCIKSQQNQLLTELSILDNMEETGPFLDAHRLQRSTIKSQLLSLATNEEILWRQKCKSKWQKEGDISTKFFHRIVAARKHKCSIREILSRHGTSLFSESDIVNKFLSFYTDLYKKRSGCRTLPPSLSWDPIDSHQRQCGWLFMILAPTNLQAQMDTLLNFLKSFGTFSSNESVPRFF